LLVKLVTYQNYEIRKKNEVELLGACSSNFNEENCMRVPVWKTWRKWIVIRT